MMGVYAIVNSLNGKMYVGSARDIQQRWRAHRHELRGGRHHSLRLQRAWNKYGEASFALQIMEVVKDVATLRDAEQRWIDFLQVHQGTTGYNAHPQATGGHPLGWRPPLSAIMKLRDGRKKGENNVNARLDPEKVREICNRYAAGESMRQLAKVYGVAFTTVGNVVRGDTWTFIDAPRYRSPSKGARGQRHGLAKLKNADIAVIRKRLEAGEKQASIAKDYGVSQTAISRIANGQRWGHISDQR